TVAAVGLLYPQIQNMISNTDTQANTVGLTVTSAYNDQDNLSLVVRNTGSETWNTSAFTLRFVPGGTGGPVGLTATISSSTTPRLYGSAGPGGNLYGNMCFYDQFLANGKSELISPGEKYDCNTGLEFPNATRRVDLVITKRGSGNVLARETCKPETANTVGC
ncbi:MAG: hypothetical protein ABEK01_02595, partial [Candidatus Nanohaloarchaea archaeon]